ncbi:hypothetical protein UM822_13160 [Staphylococcus aureus]|nr:hypothetical protein UM822_13160 [Staphylococcus aureus]
MYCWHGFGWWREDNSIGKYSEAIEYAKNNNFNITIHAGECGCIKNVYDSVELGAKRIGHGLHYLKANKKLKNFQNEKFY